MPPRRKELPDFETDPATDLVRCRICFEFPPPPSQVRTVGSRGHVASWLQRGNAAGHLTTKMHADSLARRNQTAPAVSAASSGASTAHPPAYIPTAAPALYLSDPLQTHIPDTYSSVDLSHDVYGVEMDLDSPASENSDIDLDDLSLTAEELEETELRQRTEEERRFLLALAEMSLGEPTDAFEDGTLPPRNPLDELAEFEENHGNETELSTMFERLGQSKDWSPYGSKAMFLLDLLDNLPRLRLSSAQMRIIIWMLKELGCPDVPSLYALRQMQKSLVKQAIPTVQHRSSLGNTFFSNSISAIVAQDYANPLTSSHIVNYPEECDGPKSEVWQFARWKEIPKHLLTPMFARGSTHFYVNELARTTDGALVIPVLWITRNGELCADAHLVVKDKGILTVQSDTKSIPARHFAENYPGICASYGPVVKAFSHDALSADFAAKMPNPLRALAAGKPLYTSFINSWADDVSGNVSKQYNKHENIVVTHGSLPGRLLQEEFHLHLVSTSPHATSLEQFEAVQADITNSHSHPIVAYHAHRAEICLIRNVMVCGPGDNPQQSSECSHIGLHGNFFCRDCKCGGTAKHKESPVGYEKLFEVQTLRTADSSLVEIKAQLLAAMTGVRKSVTKLQTKSGIKDAIAQYWIDQLIDKARALRQGVDGPKLTKAQAVERLKVWLETQTDQPFNPLLAMPGFDPHRDTPIEILHTVLLGIVKYAWHTFNTSWSAKDGEKFVPLQESIDGGGLSGDSIRPAYVVQYKNNLIGKHFKSLMQTIAFHAHHFGSDDLHHLVCSIGELGALLWYTEIHDLDAYLADLEILIDNVLDAFAALDPARIILKPKLHLLKHLIPNIRRFGPAVRFSTEVFESFNSVFRECSVLSNRQAPSRDIALKFASMERLKHTVCGGFWLNGEQVYRAGDKILDLAKQNPIVRQYLGLSDKSIEVGAFQLEERKKRTVNEISATTAYKLLSREAATVVATYTWSWAKSVTVISGDKCRVGSWACIRRPRQNESSPEGEVWLARVREMLATSASIMPNVLVVVDRFQLGNERHPKLRMPVLFRESLETTAVINPSEIQFIFNVQHDCISAECKVGLEELTVTQERVPSITTLPKLKHSNDLAFVINTHALHNAQLLRRVLPRHLTQPAHVHPDRTAVHRVLAAQAKASQTTKRAQTATKRTAAQTAQAVDATASDANAMTGDAGGADAAGEEDAAAGRPN